MFLKSGLVLVTMQYNRLFADYIINNVVVVVVNNLCLLCSCGEYGQ